MSSLCQAHGHSEARRYPLPMLWRETDLVRNRLNQTMASEAVLIQMAIASVLTKKGGDAFSKRIRKMTES